MLTTSKTHVKIAPAIGIVGLTLLLWLGSKWYYQDWFANPSPVKVMIPRFNL